MTCKDCIHHDVCAYDGTTITNPTKRDSVQNHCGLFDCREYFTQPLLDIDKQSKVFSCGKEEFVVIKKEAYDLIKRKNKERFDSWK